MCGCELKYEMSVFADPGVIVPPMTPFTSDGSIDYTAYEAQIQYILNRCEPAAVPLMAVEAQEYRCLSDSARREAIRRGAEAIDGRSSVIVGASAASYVQAVEIGTVATEINAEALQLLIPRRAQGGSADVTELIAFFERVEEEVGIPIVAYHNPGPGADLSPDQLVALAESDSISAFKESVRNLRHVLNLIERIDRQGLAHYYTTMEMLLMTLLMGGSGATMPAPAAVVGSELIEAFEDGETQRAVELQRSFATFPGQFLSHGFPAVMKEALEFVDIETGSPYPPTERIPETHREEIRETLATIDSI